MSESLVRASSDEEWEELMGQLRTQPGGQPGPFFYARVRARLDAKANRGRNRLGWLRRPAYAALLGAMMLLLSGDGSALPATRAPYPSSANGQHPFPTPR